MDAERKADLVAAAASSVPLPAPVVKIEAPAKPVRPEKRSVSVDIARFLMTGDEVAALMHCHKRTLNRMVERGQFPAPVKRSGGLRWRRDQVYASLGGKSGEQTRMAS